ncbi:MULTISPECIES: helix-turn-helix transcriptional regulator [unclassified Roseovarius]|uniref:helix-turn-helix domain-containing protein n=1 Tax=unclassified Roseovarius TaxID=2614913 RepID=UPI00273E11C0|nr:MULTISPECIES: helix-turn-helix transcriptional regulator [unclassified Roseovarius]
MARAALNWSLADLSSASGVHRNTISNYETGRYELNAENSQKVKTALEAAGVEFIAENGGGPGVRLKGKR